LTDEGTAAVESKLGKCRARRGGVVSSRKDVVETYIEGFRRSDHAMVTPREGDPISFVFAEVFTFDGAVVARLETFHINLD
jgi:hypothetical protein